MVAWERVGEEVGIRMGGFSGQNMVTVDFLGDRLQAVRAYPSGYNPRLMLSRHLIIRYYRYGKCVIKSPAKLLADTLQTPWICVGMNLDSCQIK